MSAYIRSFDKDFATLVANKSDSKVLIDEESGREFSWAMLDTILNQIRCFLEGNGVKPGDVVLSMLPNSMEALALFFACMRYGYGFAPLPPSSSVREIQQICDMLSPALAVILADADDRITQMSNRPKIHVAQLNLAFAWAANANSAEIATGPKDKAKAKLYMATSGSTGTPKLMVIDGDKLWSSGCAFVSENPLLGANSCFYNIMPMSYLGGLFNLGFVPLACGGKVLVAPAFSGSTVLRFWQEVIRYGVTVLWLTPTMLRALVKVVGPRWQFTSKVGLRVSAVFLGTAPIDIEEKDAFEKIFGMQVIENYGLSETTFITSEKQFNTGNRMQRSVGEVLPWVEMRLTDTVGEIEESVISKIEVRTPFLIDGYILSDGQFQPIKSDGWFDTGDIGHLNDGTLVLDGRIRDVIKKGGVLIHLSEVNTLLRQCPHVEDVATVDVSHVFYGEDYVLFLVFDGETVASDAERLVSVRSYLTDNLLQTKWPAQIIPIAAIPRTRSGKVARNELRNLIKERQ